jgi:divalent metal cation (Fe/Co/Zn/Cd) transporter
LLIFTAFVLAVESKNLLIGESADPRIVASIHRELAGDARVSEVNEVATLHMGPDFIVVTVSADFVDTLSASELESAVTDMNKRIKRIDPRLQRVFIEAERGQDHDPED